MIRKLVLFSLLLGAFVMAKAWYDTMRDPVVRTLVVTSDAMAPGNDPVTIAIVADIHMAGPDMPPSRVERIVEQVNALGADLIAIPGDLVSEKRVATRHYFTAEVVAPLAKLEAPLGVVFVPGNHDHWFGWEALSAELARQTDISVLENGARQFGPLAVAGLDDEFVGRADIEATEEAVASLTGPQVWLTHTPDTFPSIPISADIVIAGHTHCGQIAYPWGGSPKSMSEYGDKYSCGVVEEHGKTLVTSAGLGTSLLPVRLFTQPEIWLVEVRPTR